MTREVFVNLQESGGIVALVPGKEAKSQVRREEMEGFYADLAPNLLLLHETDDSHRRPHEA